MFATRGTSSKKSRSGQQLTWQSNTNKITKDLTVAGARRSPGWGSRDSPHQRLRILQGMARKRQQWRTCCQSITTK